YHRPEGSAPMLGILEDPALFLAFFFANVGSPFAKGTAIDPVIQGASTGVVITLLFTIATCYVISRRKDRELVKCSVSWLLIGAYALVTGGAMTLGRAGAGALEALESRYVSTHVLTVISLI